jgi:hypothetical protein
MSNRTAVACALALALILAPELARAQAKGTAKPAAGATTAKAAAPAKASGPAIATVLGRSVTEADLGGTPPMLVQAAQGDTAKLREMTAAWHSQALTGFVLGTLLDRWAQGQKIHATPGEVSEMLATAARAAGTDEAKKAGAPMPDTTNAEVRMAGAAVVARFKMHAALHKLYGGRVVIDPQAERLEARWRLRPPGIDAQDRHAECSAETRRLTANAPDSNDERGGLRQIHNAVEIAVWDPLAVHLLRDIAVQATGKSQKKSHNMGADMIVINLPLIGDHHIAFDQFFIVVAHRRCGRRCLQPAQAFSAA